MNDRKEIIMLYLNETDVFSRIPQNEKETLVSKMEDIIFDKGETVRIGNNFFVIKKGFVKVEKINQDGRSSTIKIFGPGDFFCSISGEDLWLVPLTESLICVIEDFEDILKRCPKLNLGIMKKLIEIVEELQEKLHSMITEKSEEKIISVILNLYRRFGEDGEIKVPITHQDIADMSGCARETVSRLLSHLKKVGIIEYKRNGIIIKNLKKLKEFKRFIS